MVEMAVDSRVYTANARSAPRFGDNVVGVLHQCDPVDVTGPQQGDRWLPCRARIGGAARVVFVSRTVLRQAVSPPRERLMRECVKQWLRFDRSEGKETDDPYAGYVGEFWASIGMALDGGDVDVPWSAAFISFCVRTAGGYSGFKYAAGHARYVHQAIRRRLDGVAGPFWGYRVGEHRPQLGDMVCARRAGNRITYDGAAARDRFKSHCDIVVSVRQMHVSTLGGNVGNSVGRTSYPLDGGGYLVGTGKVYAVLRNNR